MALTYRPLTGTYVNGTDQPSFGEVVLTPSSPLTDANGRLIVAQLPIPVQLGGTGFFSVPLLCTDNADLSPAGWVWHADVQVPGAEQRFSFLLPTGDGSPVDISSLMPAGNPPPVAGTYVTSFNGASGAVTGVGSSSSLTITGTPSAGQVVTATGPATADWATPAAIPGAATTVQPGTAYGTASTVGTDITYAREDHQHGTPPLASSAPSTTEGVGQAAATGTASSPARADHVHPLAAAGTPGTSAVGDSPATGAATTFAASDHTHGREGFGAVTAQTSFGLSSSTGTAATVAHSDHQHGTPSLTSSAPATTEGVGTAAATGTATTAARADHVHPMAAAGVPGSSAVGDAASTGVATTPAASDHRHAREGFGTPGSSAVGDAPAAGVSASVAHADHVHGRESFGSPGSSAVGDSASAGTATTVAHSDHKHGREAFGSVTALTAFGTASATGSATTVAHSDHVHGAPALPTASTSTAGIVQLDGTAADIAALGAQAAGSTGKAADGGHVHPTTGVLTVANNLSDVQSAASARLNIQSALALVPTTVKTAAYTASPGDLIPVNVSAGSITVTFPASAPDRTVVAVKTVATSGSNVVNLALQGSDVFNAAGGPNTGTLKLANQGLVAQYSASAGIWYVYSDDLPLSQLDARYASSLVSGVVALGSVSGNVNCDLSLGSTFTATITGATVFTFINWPSGSTATEPTVIATQDSTGHAISFSGVTWLPSGNPPSFQTGASQVNVVPFFSPDDGTTIYGQGGASSGGGFGVYGDGSDGAVILDGTNTYAFLGKSGNTYWLTRDVYLTSLTVNSGVTLQLAGGSTPSFRLSCTGTVSVASGGFIATLANTNASGATGGSNLSTGTILPGANGPNGGTGAGAAGTNVLGQSGGFAGHGGAASSGGTAGGTNGVSTLTSGYSLPHALPWAAFVAAFGPNITGNFVFFPGGASGGAGAGDGTNSGGGGGAGGNPLYIAAENLVNNGTIQAKGGIGGNATGGNAGGGGGGQGGPVMLIYGSTSGSGSVVSTGGNGGTASGTGTAGASGGAAWIIKLVN